MGQFFNFNGKIYPIERPVIGLDNRAFNYGDGLFETIRVRQGEPLQVEAHFERLKNGMELLSLGPLDLLSSTVLQADLEELIAANGIFEGGRIKLMVFRKTGGFYSPKTNKFDYLITADAYPHNNYQLNAQGLKVGLYSELKKSINFLSNIKSSNALVYVLAGVYAKSKSMDEVFILNENNQIIEAASSNVFLVMENNNVITPPLISGCLAGVMRQRVISILIRMDLTLTENVISLRDLQLAKEIILTNTIAGVQWVGAYEKRRYVNHLSKKLVPLLNR